MPSQYVQLDRTPVAHPTNSVAAVLALAIAALGGCAGTTPRPPAQPTPSRSPGPCWLLSIEEVTNNTLEQQGDSMQLVATYRFGTEHEAGDEEHSPFELSSRTTRWRVNEWPDHLDTHPVALCTPEIGLPPDPVNGQVSPTH
jgi:hypothetical protein